MAEVDDEWLRFQAEIAAVETQAAVEDTHPGAASAAAAPALAPPATLPAPAAPPPTRPPPVAIAQAPAVVAKPPVTAAAPQAPQFSAPPAAALAPPPAPPPMGVQGFQQHGMYGQQGMMQQGMGMGMAGMGMGAMGMGMGGMGMGMGGMGMQQQLQQQQQQAAATGAAKPGGSKPAQQQGGGKKKVLLREAGGQKWVDPSLNEWADNDFRIFVGDLGNEVTDDLLAKSFSKYSSFAKAKIVRDPRTKKSKGFGFVSFLDGNDFAKALREMNGKYIGNRPCKLSKSNWDERTVRKVTLREPPASGANKKQKR